MPEVQSLLAALPLQLPQEQFDALLTCPGLRIERIVSTGQASPPDHWYDQDEHEWVLVLQGAGRLAFADGRELLLQAGDAIELPAHCRHRVAWTDPDQPTVWLAVFWR